MILESLRDRYIALGRKRAGRGNPTGSKLGTCAAQLQQLMWRDRIDPPPAPWQPRSVMTVEVGDVLGRWLRENIGHAFPGVWGLHEQPFYLRLPYPDQVKPDEVERVFGARVTERLPDNSRRLWGTLLGPKDRFTPPKVERLKGGQLKLTGISLGAVPERDWRGLVLEPRRRALWTPVFVDGVLAHPDAGLAVVELKTMSTPAFRRAVLGQMDYGYRCQLAAAVRAPGFDAALWLTVRKETAHLAEIAFTRKPGATRVDLVRPSGARETFLVRDADRALLEPAGGAGDPITLDRMRDAWWDTAFTWTPFDDEAIFREMATRAWRVILSDPDAENPWWREYGPVFTCGLCEGTGRQSKAKRTGVLLKGGSKPCIECHATGVLDEAELPWQCAYCDVVQACYGRAGVTLEIDSRPHYRIRREAFEASGLAFTPLGRPAGDETESAESEA